MRPRLRGARVDRVRAAADPRDDGQVRQGLSCR